MTASGAQQQNGTINRFILKHVVQHLIDVRVRHSRVFSAIVSCGFLLVCGSAPAGTGSDSNPSLQIVSARAYRVGENRLGFRIESAAKPDPARLRILLDVDGLGHGEPNSGADYMMEGPTFYRYPEGAKGWQWEAIGAALIVGRGNQLICVLPEGFRADSVRWYVETTDKSWATADRFPKQGSAEFNFQYLPSLPAEELAPEVSAPGLKITDVTPLRVTDGGLAFKVTFAAKPDPARFRVLLDTDQPRTHEAASGADYMIEGVNFYEYPPGASNWTWNALAPPVIIAEGNTLTYILLDAPVASSVKWLAETTNPDWSSAYRFPPIGKSEFKPQALLDLKLDVRHRPEDVSELTDVQPSLSQRFDDEIHARRWEAVENESAPAPTWEVASMHTSFPVRVTLHDVVSGQTEAATPVHVFRSGNTMRWEGTTLGIGWTLLAAPGENGDVWFTGELRSNTNRCLRVAAGCSLKPVGWTWHDDVRFHRPMATSTDPYQNVVASSCGVRGEQSLYPFGAISSSRGVLIAETDPDEPRICQIVAEADNEFFGVDYDLALTPATAKFPGKATFRWALRSLPAGQGDPFRRVLAAFYQRNAGYGERRVPVVGLWMPFFDISTIPHAEDFGFAFFEKEGVAAKDVDYCETNGILTLAYTEPWLYWLPLPGKNRTEAEAVRRMKFYAAAGNDQRSEFAAAALLGAVRKPDDSLRMQFMDVPWNSGARMEVSTDPELPTTPVLPINRAMSEWRHVKQVLQDRRYDGVYLDSMSAMDTVDYNPAAIAVANYPCTYEAGVFQPGLSTKIASYEYIADLGRALQKRGRYLMGNFPCWGFPYYMKYIDIPGEETTWWLGSRYQPLSDQQLIYRRAISGHKPYGFLQASKFDEFKGPLVERYFRDCLFWGFLPSFFSADGASNPYWTKPEWYERDRYLFKTYIPIIRRLASAGWHPLGPERADSDNLWVEHFGAADSAIQHLTLRNTQDTVLTTKLSLGATNEPTILLNPLDGGYDLIETTEKAALVLPGSGIGVRDIVPVSRLSDEIAFMRGWNSGSGEAEACRKTLTSVQTEIASRIRCTLKMPPALVRDEANTIGLEIANRGGKSTILSDLKAVRGAQLTGTGDSQRTVAPGQSSTISGALKAGTNDWIEIQWQLAEGGTNLVLQPRLQAEVHRAFDRRMSRGQPGGRWRRDIGGVDVAECERIPPRCRLANAGRFRQRRARREVSLHNRSKRCSCRSRRAQSNAARCLSRLSPTARRSSRGAWT